LSWGPQVCSGHQNGARRTTESGEVKSKRLSVVCSIVEGADITDKVFPRSKQNQADGIKKIVEEEQI